MKTRQMALSLLLFFSVLSVSQAEHAGGNKKQYLVNGGYPTTYRECMRDIGDPAYCLAMFPISELGLQFFNAVALENVWELNYFEQVKDLIGNGHVFEGSCFSEKNKKKRDFHMGFQKVTSNYMTAFFKWGKFDQDYSKLPEANWKVLRLNKHEKDNVFDPTLVQGDLSIRMRRIAPANETRRPYPFAGDVAFEISKIGKNGKTVVTDHCWAKAVSPKGLEVWTAVGKTMRSYSGINKQAKYKSQTNILNLPIVDKKHRKLVIGESNGQYDFESKTPLVFTKDRRVWEGDMTQKGTSTPYPRKLMYIEEGNPTKKRTLVIQSPERKGGPFYPFYPKGLEKDDVVRTVELITNDGKSTHRAGLAFIHRKKQDIVITGVREGFGNLVGFKMREKKTFDLSNTKQLRQFETVDMAILNRVAPEFGKRLVASRRPLTPTQIREQISGFQQQLKQLNQQRESEAAALRATIERLQTQLRTPGRPKGREQK